MLWLCSILWCNVGVPTGNARIWSPAMCTSPPIGSPDVLWMGMEMIQDGPDLMRRSGTNQQLGGHPCNILKKKRWQFKSNPKTAISLLCLFFIAFGPHTKWGYISKHGGQHVWSLGAFAKNSGTAYHARGTPLEALPKPRYVNIILRYSIYCNV